MSREWLCAFIGVLGWVAGARADLSIAWHGPSTCPSAQEADERLRARSQGASLLSEGRAEVWIDHTPNGELRARIRLHHAEGREQRLLYGHDCEELTEAVLLVISMASDQNAPEPKPPRPPPPASPTPPPPPETPARPVELQDDSQAPARASRPLATSVRLGALLGLDVGSLPSTSLAGGAALAIGARRFQAALSASYFTPERVNVVGGAPGARADFRLVAAKLEACYAVLGAAFDAQPRSRRYAVAPCVSLELGAQHGGGTGLPEAATHTGLWAASLFGLSLSLGPYGRVVPTGSLALGVPLRRPRFEVEDAGLLFQARSPFLRTTLGLMIELNR
ncbi:MAG: hypothetical protein QM778_30455 [Myxococcales bacterium]